MNTTTTKKENMTTLTNISEGFTPPEHQSKWIQREVERLMARGDFEEGYAMYKTDPTIEIYDAFDTFVAKNR